LSSCDGTIEPIPSDFSCSIPLSTLITAPFGLLKDQSVLSKVKAVNFYGDSDFSPAGNGAIVVLIPDAPDNFANDPTITNEDQISMTWVDGASDGGEPVLDYKI
jgi:hypothetical protein